MKIWTRLSGKISGLHAQGDSLRQKTLDLATAGKTLMLGLALGDALGWPTEFKKIGDIQKKFGEAGIQEPPNPAIFTDDTQMTIAVARALIAHPHGKLDLLMPVMAREFVDWGISPENNRAPGLSCMAGIRNLIKGTDWSEAGALDAKGCGAAMRAAPIGFLYQEDPELLKKVAIASAQPTHRHPSAIAAAVAAAYLVKLALDNVDPSDMSSRLSSFVGGMSDDFDKSLKVMQSVLSWGDQVAAMDQIGQGWVGHEAVPLALYCVIKYPDSWVDTVRRGANFSGDSDSVASIAGGIQALRLGIDSIPSEWIARVEKKELLEELGMKLAASRS